MEATEMTGTEILSEEDRRALENLLQYLTNPELIGFLNYTYGNDHLAPEVSIELDRVIRAYKEIHAKPRTDFERFQQSEEIRTCLLGEINNRSIEPMFAESIEHLILAYKKCKKENVGKEKYLALRKEVDTLCRGCIGNLKKNQEEFARKRKERKEKEEKEYLLAKNKKIEGSSKKEL